MINLTKSQLKSDTFFGPHRVKIRVYDRGDIYYSDKHYSKLIEITDWCLCNTRTMSSYPGQLPGEVVFCFQDEDDAVLFALKWA